MAFQGHRARKRFGQHWLTDATVLDRIVAAAELEEGERVLEVGPGRGALTERLLAAPIAALRAVVDRDPWPPLLHTHRGIGYQLVTSTDDGSHR
jgi:16S rRNA (adenine1518-N6/adenine1519-N6)-dimethyltransferase